MKPEFTGIRCGYIRIVMDGIPNLSDPDENQAREQYFDIVRRNEKLIADVLSGAIVDILALPVQDLCAVTDGIIGSYIHR